MNKRQKDKKLHSTKKRKKSKAFTNRILTEIKSFDFEEMERLGELLPAVKYAYWWDSTGLMNLMDTQLKYMIKNWDDAHYVDYEVHKLEMETAQGLLNLLIKDAFMDKYYKILDDKYGVLTFINNTIQRTNETELTDIETTKFMELANAEKEKTKKEFFTIMMKYEDWWD